MWYMLVYGTYKLQEVRKRPIRLTEVLDVLYYLPRKWFGVALYDDEEGYVKALEELVERGYLERGDNGNFIVTERGRRVAEAVSASSDYVKMIKGYIDEVVEEYTRV